MVDLSLELSALIVMLLVNSILIRIIYVDIKNLMVKRKAYKFGTPDLCCCGSMLDDHGWSDNHPFVSEMEYYIESNTLKY